MNRKLLVPTLTALALSIGGAAFAQDGRNNDRGPGHDQRRGPQGQRFERPPNANVHGPENGRPPMHADNRGAGPDHNFRRGGRLPNEYRNRQYVVDDWRGHHLNAPPRGYHWVQTGGDYVLVAIATGIIAQILLGQ